MIHLKKLCERVGFDKGRPAQEYLLCEQGERYDRISVFAGEDFMMVYTVNGRRIRLSLDVFAGKNLEAYWMDPVTGIYTYMGAPVGGGEAEFYPPEREDGEDIVLLIQVVDRRENVYE